MELFTIKNDLLNKLTNDLYIAETDLERIVNNTNIMYKIQLTNIENILENIILIKTKISALNSYFIIEEKTEKTEK